MDGQELVDALRDARATQLDRLGSDKYLVAATGADLERAPVLRVLAAEAASGRDTFSRWADEAVGDVAAAFETAAERERQQFDRVVDSLAGLPDDGADATDAIDGEADPAHRALRDCDDPVERVAAAFVGRPLVADRTRLQVVNFFVNEADEQRADLARDLRSEANGRLDEGVELLDSVCGGDSDWERADRAATNVIDAAYEAYVDSLEAMDVDPKPVC
ncbi:MAG: rubrerythrin family protein [Halosimplex sp.]